VTDASQRLAETAREARSQAFAPYSGFAVGAAAETTDGRVFTGCNVENASYGLTMCAERLAVFKAISEGVRPGGFVRVAICAETERLTPPCGACRQILWEFCRDAEVLLLNTAGKMRSFKVAELLPEAFDDSLLG
jgi:cytidine deaminase